SRHGKYVSEINLAASAVKYSLARSKKVINIDNHITSAGSYSTFQNWLDGLAEEEEHLPNGLLFLAFDNEQKGQKNYLDRGSNIVIYHIVTSFVAFNKAPHEPARAELCLARAWLEVKSVGSSRAKLLNSWLEPNLAWLEPA